MWYSYTDTHRHSSNIHPIKYFTNISSRKLYSQIKRLQDFILRGYERLIKKKTQKLKN